MIRRKIAFPLLIIAFYLASASTTWAGWGWDIYIVDSDDVVGQHTSIDVDASKTPIISYHKITGSDLKFAVYPYSNEVVDLDNVGQFTSIAIDTKNDNIDANDVYHISYYDVGNGDLKYARKDLSATGTWQPETVDSAGDVGQYTSIALDSAGYPHISYYDATSHALKYVKWMGSSWDIPTVPDPGSDVGQYTSIALDAADNPHISYYDSNSYDLKYAKWTGSSWDIQTADSAGNVGQYSSIAIDANGDPHISYYDAGNGHLKYAKETAPATWDAHTVDPGPDVGEYSSIALDTGGNPCISYYDAHNHRLKYAQWTGATADWLTEEVDTGAGSPGVGLYTSIALDSERNIHISYYDGNNQDLKYAEGIRAPVDIILVLDLSGSMNDLVPGSLTMTKLVCLQQAVEWFINAWSPFAVPGDRMGIVYFGSSVDSFPGGSPNLLNFITSKTNLINDVNDWDTASGWTALGGGIQRAINGFETGDMKKFIVVYTDGMQNYNPMVWEEHPPVPSQIVDVVGPIPGVWPEDWVTRPKGSSGVPGVPGTTIDTYDIPMHTIGIGIQGAYWITLLDYIASQTSGLYDSTDDPLAESYKQFVNTLVASIQANTVEMVRYTTAKSISMGEEKTETFLMNSSVSRAAFMVAWRNKDNSLSVELEAPDGTPIDLRKRITHGDFYEVVTLTFPLVRYGQTIDHNGQWKLTIKGDKVRGSDIYDATLLVDETKLKYDFSLPLIDYGVGEAIPLRVKITEDGEPVKDLTKVIAHVTHPQLGIGTFMSKHIVDEKELHQDIGQDAFPTTIDKKFDILLQDEEKRAELKPVAASIDLYDDGKKEHGDEKADDGIYSNLWTNTKRPGHYEFELEIEGQTPQAGEFVRTDVKSTLVRIKRVSPENTRVKAEVIEREPDGSAVVLITAIPVDDSENILGPGYQNQIKINSTRGEFVGKLEDHLDGSYWKRLKLDSLLRDPTITIEVLGEKVYQEPLSRLVKIKRWSSSLGFGLAIPVGDLSDDYDPGYNVIVDLGYDLSPRLSILGLFGYNRFKGKSNEDFYWLNLSANARYYLTRGRYNVFLGAGTGVYIPQEGSAEFGLNAGGGLRFLLNPNFSVETGADFHNMFSGDRFIHVHVGLISKLPF